MFWASKTIEYPPVSVSSAPMTLAPAQTTGAVLGVGAMPALRLAEMNSIALGFAVGRAIVGIILLWRAPKPRWAFVLTLAAILGAIRFNLVQSHFDQTTPATRSANDQPKPVIVKGLIVDEPGTRDAYTNLRIEADQLIITDQPTRTVKGPVLVQAPPSP